jgi:hypothetical protein
VNDKGRGQVTRTSLETKKDRFCWIGKCVCRSWSPNCQTTFSLKFDPRDDDDEFLYGDSELKESSLSKVPDGLVVDPVPSAGEKHLF